MPRLSVRLERFLGRLWRPDPGTPGTGAPCGQRALPSGTCDSHLTRTAVGMLEPLRVLVARFLRGQLETPCARGTRGFPQMWGELAASRCRHGPVCQLPVPARPPARVWPPCPLDWTTTASASSLARPWVFLAFSLFPAPPPPASV